MFVGGWDVILGPSKTYTPPPKIIINKFILGLKVQSHQILDHILGTRKLNHYSLWRPFMGYSIFYFLVPEI